MVSGEVAAYALLGAVAGLGSGWVAVWLERVEKLEQEENEDREAYDREMADATAAAGIAGTTPPVKEPWEHEKYGWTWLEWFLSPVLGALTFAWFASAAIDRLDAVPRPAPGEVHRLLAIHLLWLVIFVHIVGFDIKHRLILNRVTFPSMAMAVVLSPFTPNLGIVAAVAGGVVVYALFMAQSLVLGSGVIGRGDAKLGAVLGAVTGLGLSPDHLQALWAVITAFILGGIGAVAVLLFRSVRATLAARRPLQMLKLFFNQLRRSMKEPIPYGPFLCAGAVLWLMNNLG